MSRQSGKCPECRYTIALRAGGTIGKHHVWSGHEYVGVCIGTGHEPLAATVRERAPDGGDRTVHAETRDGLEIVHYNRAYKWFAEHADGGDPPRQLKMAEAARLAVTRNAFVHFGRPGGLLFDSKVRHFRFLRRGQGKRDR